MGTQSSTVLVEGLVAKRSQLGYHMLCPLLFRNFLRSCDLRRAILDIVCLGKCCSGLDKLGIGLVHVGLNFGDMRFKVCVIVWLNVWRGQRLQLQVWLADAR